MSDPRSGAPRERETSRLERPQSGSAWRVSAAAVALLLVAIVALGRLGMEPAAPAPSPSPPVAAASSVPPSVLPTVPEVAAPPPTSRPMPTSGPPVDPGVAFSASGRYADGIPLSIGGEPVLRLPNALELDTAGSFLLGAWYIGPDCGGLGHGGACPHGRLADTPADFSRRGGSVGVAQLAHAGTGPRVLRARLTGSQCAYATCPALRVEDVVWAGDALTDTGPIDVVPLMSALGFAFPEMAAAPYTDLAQCPVPWPPQTFLSTTGGPRLTLVFPTEQDRLDAQAAVRAGRALLLAEEGGECIDQPGRFRASGRWIAEANVMVLLRPGEATLDLATAAFADARIQSGRDDEAAGRPITTWQALRRLWRVEPTLDLLPPTEQAACHVGLPPEMHPLGHEHLLLLGVFADRAARRAFQRNAAADVAAQLREGCHMRGQPLVTLGEVEWIGFENVAVAFSGADWLRDAVREALRGTGTP